MLNFKKYVLLILCFLLIGELTHIYIKNTIKNKNNKNEGFVNYNELPHISNINKSYPRHISSNIMKIDEGLQPIVIKTKLLTLTNNKLPIIGYYGNNSYASIIPLNIIRKKILPINYIAINDSNEVYNKLNNKDIDIGLIRDCDVLRLLNKNKLMNIRILLPMYYETIFLFTSKDLSNITHFQLINLQTKPIKLYTTKNDKLLLDIIIEKTNIDTSKLEIYIYNNLEDVSVNFILNPLSICFICCHFKNKILRQLFNSVICVSLDYIPTMSSLLQIGNYSNKNPINEDALLKIKDSVVKNLTFSLVSPDFEVSNLLYHNLSKNNLLNRNNSNVYNTFHLRLSLYIRKDNLFTNEQLFIFASNSIKWYQTFSSELDKWNYNELLDNNDNLSYKLDTISMIDSRIKIEENVKNKMIQLGYIYMKK